MTRIRVDPHWVRLGDVVNVILENAMTEQILVPTVHLNGTSKDELIRQFSEAICAVHEAGRKLAAACPNGRDLYVQGPGAILDAMRQHEDRLKRIKSVATELETILEKVDEQGRAPGR